MQTLRTGAATDLLAVEASSRSILGFNLVSMHTKSFDATLKLFGATIMDNPFFRRCVGENQALSHCFNQVSACITYNLPDHE